RRHDDDLLRRVESEVEREEHLGKARRRPAEDVAEGGKRPLGPLPVALVAGELGEPEEVHDRDRVARRLGAVAARLLAGEQRLAVLCRPEEAAGLPVLEARAQHAVERDRGLEPAGRARRLVEIEEAGAEERVVLEIAGRARTSVLHGPREPPLAVAVREEELGGARRARRVLLVAEREPGAGVGGDHEAVPAGEDLLVARRRRPATPCGEEEAPGLVERPLGLGGRISEPRLHRSHRLLYWQYGAAWGSCCLRVTS